jgi:hypothetical protein
VGTSTDPGSATPILATADFADAGSAGERSTTIAGAFDQSISAGRAPPVVTTSIL